ncbi:MAG: amino acid permease [Theionarchaea archaeon]|nr:amino acid permease [Theionarchaea archaeon]
MCYHSMVDGSYQMKRELDFSHGLAIVVGGIVGVGMLIIPGMAAGVAGPASLLAWVCTGILCMFMATSFAQLASMFDESGGPYRYVREGFGKIPGFIAGWSGLVGAWVALSVLTLLIPQYLSPLIHLSRIGETFVSLSVISLLSIINIRGIRLGGFVQLLLFSGLLLTLLLFIGGGALHFQVDHFSPFMPGGWRSVGKAMGLTMWAYLGWEYALMPASEYKNPKKDLPRVIIVGTFLIILLYSGVAVSCLGTVSWQHLADTTTPLILASTLWGGAVFIACGSVLIMCGCLNAGLLSSARLVHSMAQGGVFPHSLSHIHHRFRTPHRALLVQWIIMSLLAMMRMIEKFVYLSNVLFLVSYLLSFLSLIPLKKRVTPLPLLSAGMCGFLISQLGVSTMLQASCIIGIGLVACTAIQKKEKIKKNERLNTLIG